MRYLHRHAGASRLAAARTQLPAVLAGWSANWRADHAQTTLEIDVEPLDDAANVTVDAGTWRAFVLGRSADALPHDAFSDHLLASARASLQRTLAGEDAASADGHPRLRVTIRDGATELHAGIDSRRFGRAPCPPTTPTPLAPRADAIRRAKAALQLHFPLARVTVAELRRLAPGVVIRSAQPLDEPLRLGTSSAPDALRARLGRRGRRLAARIAASESPRQQEPAIPRTHDTASTGHDAMTTPTIENLSLEEFGPSTTASPVSPSRLPRDLDLVRHVQVALHARIGTATLSIERLYALAAGDIVTLNESVDEPVTLYVEDRAVARGLLVAVDDHLGLEIREILAP